MKLSPYAGYDELARRAQLYVSESTPWSGVIYRSTAVKYSRPRDIVSGEGSRINGGRWNAPGTFRAVYGSNSAETALAESLAFFRKFGIPVFQAMPRVFVAIECSLQSVFDLRDRDLAKRFGVPGILTVRTDWRKEQDNGFEAITQALGRACYEAGVEGILVRSAAAPDGFNIVVFPDSVQADSTFEVLKSGELPPDPV